MLEKFLGEDNAGNVSVGTEFLDCQASDTSLLEIKIPESAFTGKVTYVDNNSNNEESTETDNSNSEESTETDIGLEFSFWLKKDNDLYTLEG
jgi:hypothetical protein